MSATLVQTSYGQVKGKQVDRVSVWKGIPYAKAPIGTLRFQPPQKLEGWEGVYEATHFGPAAIQPESEVMRFLGSHIAEDEMSEDCLYLNIWSPAADNQKRPVMVWIHGGAFLYGAGSSPIYDGQSFAANHDVVVVTINYRIGVLGFLHLGSVDGEQYAGAGNCGILDQVAALEWVRENIEAFGGDPNNITIFGQSAGAMSIGVLMAIPSAKGLFNKAILQSGAARNALSPVIAEQVCSGILANLEIAKDDIAKLQEASVQELLEASKNVPPMLLGPVIDGVVIQEAPEISIANGASKDIAVLIGTTKDEYNLFSYFDPMISGLNSAGIEQLMAQVLGPKWSQIKASLQHETIDKTFYEKVLSFDTFSAPAIWLAEQQSKLGAPVWMYRFDWETPVFNGELKSCHALELPFMWNNIGPETAFLLGESPNKVLAYKMQKAWATFALNGDPNIEELPIWSSYYVKTREMMIFDNECKTIHDSDSEQRLIWESVSLSAN